MRRLVLDRHHRHCTAISRAASDAELICSSVAWTAASTATNIRTVHRAQRLVCFIISKTGLILEGHLTTNYQIIMQLLVLSNLFKDILHYILQSQSPQMSQVILRADRVDCSL